MKSAPEQLAILMRTWRAEFRFSQTELADLLEMKQQYVAKLEAGDANPTLSTVERIAAVIGPFTLQWTP